MSTEAIETPAPEAAPQETPNPQAEATEQTDAQSTEETEKTGETDKPEGEKTKKPEEWWEKELRKKQRRIDNLTRRLYERPEVSTHLTQQGNGGTNEYQQDDGEPLSLSRAEFERLATERARQLAPQIAENSAAMERRTGVYRSLESALGAEKFADLSRDLEMTLDGLREANGRPKPLVDAIFDSESPRAVLEYLADPDHAAEAESFSQMPPMQLGRAMAKLEAKLAAKKAEEKPQPSKAAAVIEPIKGSGSITSAPDPKDTKAWIKWANERESKR